MPPTKRKSDLFLTDEQKQNCLQALVTYFNQERDEKIGLVAAEKILDFILQETGEHIYNKAIFDAQKLLKKRFEDLDLDLELLINK